MSAVNTPTSSPSLSIPPSVRCVVQEDGAVLLNIESGLMYSVNHVGSLIWKKLDEGSTVEEIAVFISGHCGIPIDDSRQDVQMFVNDLMRNRLVAKNGHP